MINPFPSQFVIPKFISIQIFATHDSVRPFRASVFIASVGDTSEADGFAVALNMFSTDPHVLAREVAQWARISFSQVMDTYLIFSEPNTMPQKYSLLGGHKDHAKPVEKKEDPREDIIRRLKNKEIFVGPGSDYLH